MLDRLLGSALRAKVIGWLFTHPDERFFVRQLAGILGEDPTNTGRELARLAKVGILTCMIEGRQKYYQADRDCPIFAELRGLAIKTAGVAQTLVAALEPLRDRIELAFVYGSMARGDFGAASDVDLLVVGGLPFGEVVGALVAAQERLGRETNPTVYVPAEFRRRLAEGQPFLREVVAGPKVFVIGDHDVLTRLAGEPPAR